MKDEDKRARILNFYVPVAIWIEKQVADGKNCGIQEDGLDCGSTALVIGLSIPQGGGKTTISGCLESALKVLNINTGVVSYDDFYLTYEDQ